MTERWLPVEGYEGLYAVSDHGRVRNERTGRILIGSSAGLGYRKVSLYRGGAADHRFIHHLVLRAFVGPKTDGHEACHNNGKRDDNRAENLRWDTRSNNHADKLAHGTSIRGEAHPRRKLNADEVRAIRSANGTCAEIGRQYGIGPMQVSRIRRRVNWSAVQ